MTTPLSQRHRGFLLYSEWTLHMLFQTMQIDTSHKRYYPFLCWICSQQIQSPMNKQTQSPMNKTILAVANLTSVQLPIIFQ